MAYAQVLLCNQRVLRLARPRRGLGVWRSPGVLFERGPALKRQRNTRSWTPPSAGPDSAKLRSFRAGVDEQVRATKPGRGMDCARGRSGALSSFAVKGRAQPEIAGSMRAAHESQATSTVAGAFQGPAARRTDGTKCGARRRQDKSDAPRTGAGPMYLISQSKTAPKGRKGGIHTTDFAAQPSDGPVRAPSSIAGLAYSGGPRGMHMFDFAAQPSDGPARGPSSVAGLAYSGGKRRMHMVDFAAQPFG